MFFQADGATETTAFRILYPGIYENLLPKLKMELRGEEKVNL